MSSFEDYQRENKEGRTPEVLIQKEEGLERFTKLDPEKYKQLLSAVNGDEEVLFWAAMAFEHSERVPELIGQWKRHKPHVDDFESVVREVGGALQNLEPSEVSDETTVPHPQERIENLISYFHPSDVPEKIFVVPSDRITTPNSGRGIQIGRDGYIISHSTNPINFDHEFLHFVINPLVERIGAQLSNQQKKKISEAARGGLRKDYGEDWYSLLCEEIIRTYNLIEADAAPMNFDMFYKKIEKMTDEEFDRAAREESDTSLGFSQMGIKRKSYLLTKAKEYFEKYSEDKLGYKIYELYKKYEKIKDEPFEEFLSNNINELAES